MLSYVNRVCTILIVILLYNLFGANLSAQTQFPALTPIDPNNSHTHSLYRYQLPNQQVSPLQQMRQKQQARIRQQNQQLMQRGQQSNREKLRQVEEALAEENAKRQHQNLFQNAFWEINSMLDGST